MSTVVSVHCVSQCTPWSLHLSEHISLPVPRDMSGAIEKIELGIDTGRWTSPPPAVWVYNDDVWMIERDVWTFLHVTHWNWKIARGKANVSTRPDPALMRLIDEYTGTLTYHNKHVITLNWAMAVLEHLSLNPRVESRSARWFAAVSRAVCEKQRLPEGAGDDEHRTADDSGEDPQTIRPEAGVVQPAQDGHSTGTKRARPTEYSFQQAVDVDIRLSGFTGFCQSADTVRGVVLHQREDEIGLYVMGYDEVLYVPRPAVSIALNPLPDVHYEPGQRAAVYRTHSGHAHQRWTERGTIVKDNGAFCDVVMDYATRSGHADIRKVKKDFLRPSQRPCAWLEDASSATDGPANKRLRTENEAAY